MSDLHGCVAHDKPRKDCIGCGLLLGPGWWRPTHAEPPDTAHPTARQGTEIEERHE